MRGKRADLSGLVFGNLTVLPTGYRLEVPLILLARSGELASGHPREGRRAVRLSRKLLDALSPVEPQYPPSMRPEIKQAAAWRAFRTALLSDPHATWEEEAK